MRFFAVVVSVLSLFGCYEEKPGEPRTPNTSSTGSNDAAEGDVASLVTCTDGTTAVSLWEDQDNLDGEAVLSIDIATDGTYTMVRYTIIPDQEIKIFDHPSGETLQYTIDLNTMKGTSQMSEHNIPVLDCIKENI